MTFGRRALDWLSPGRTLLLISAGPFSSLGICSLAALTGELSFSVGLPDCTDSRLLDTFLCISVSPSSRKTQAAAHQTSPPGDLRDIPNHHAQNRTPELFLKLGPHRLPISGTATPSSQFRQLKCSSLPLISFRTTIVPYLHSYNSLLGSLPAPTPIPTSNTVVLDNGFPRNSNNSSCRKAP